MDRLEVSTAGSLGWRAVGIYGSIADPSLYPWLALGLALSYELGEVDRDTLGKLVKKARDDGAADGMRERLKKAGIPFRKLPQLRGMIRRRYGLAWDPSWEQPLAKLEKPR